MPDFDTAASALRTELDTQLATKQPDVQIVHDNEPPLGQKPGTKTPSTEHTEWVRSSCVDGAAVLPEIGSRLADRTGRFNVQVFVPIGHLDPETGAVKGDTRALSIAKSIAEIFQARRISNVLCLATEITFSGPDPQGESWWMTTVSTRFQYESTPA